VAESTKNKILEIVKNLDYQPNILASTLASKKSALFATLFPKPPSPDGYWTRPAIGVKKRVAELRSTEFRFSRLLSVKPIRKFC
jgi:LacI family transcriptional regulator